MSYSNIASTINLYSGQIFFGDPTKPWDPSSLALVPPVYPSTNLIMSASGRVEDQTFTHLTFPNEITYEPYEQSTIRSTLIKTLVVDVNGNVSYTTPHIGYVSSYNAAFQAPISSFTASTIGGANIVTPNDTITNALAKLDSWITNAFLLQPPCITPVEYISSSVYGSVRWNNFNTYSILNTFAPYVTSIAFIIGDPTTANYLTLEWSGQDYFPFKLYTDGITPIKTPLVKLRLFTDFFPKIGSKSYTKQTMKTNCMTLLSESGTYTLPSKGKVFSIEDTNHISSYTTFNLFVPNLPKDTPIPISISYLNHTMPTPNVCATSTVITSLGAPNEPAVSVSTGTVHSVVYRITPPTYSDTVHNITEPFISTYSIKYTWNKFQSVYDTTSGYLYGAPDINTLPDFLSSYQSTYTNSIPYFASTLVTTQSGIGQAPYIPASVFQTSVSATNSAGNKGPYTSDVYASTLFTSTRASTLKDIQLAPKGQIVNSNALYTPVYTVDGWKIGPSSLTNVFFLSTPTNVPIAAVAAGQFNDRTFPGDRTPITITTFHTDINGNRREIDFQMSVSTGTNDYVLQTPYMKNNVGNDIMYATLSETNTTLGFSHYFYNVLLEGQPLISTVSATPQTVQLAITNTALVGGVPTTQTVSTSTYSFSTDAFDTFTYDEAGYTSTASQVVYISGLPTATDTAQLYWNAKATNQLSKYACSSFGYASLRQEDTTVGPTTQIMSSLTVLSSGIPVTTTPWPNLLQYSSLTVSLNNTIFQDPVCPHPFYIDTTLFEPYPLGSQSIAVPLTSSFYIDTISAYSNVKFQDPTGIQGLHIRSFLPLSGTTSNDIGDGVSCSGQTSNGLDVPYSSTISITPTALTLASTILYDNTSNLEADYPNTYSRELMMLQGSWLHPVEFDFSPFDASLYGISMTFPNFNYDLVYDNNQGYRYATFLYNTVLSTPTAFSGVDVTVNNTNFIGPLTTNLSTGNTFFPDAPIQQAYLQYSKVKLHVKHFATYNTQECQTIETAWINGLKQNVPQFNETVYDEGGCYNVSTIGATSSITYSVLMPPHFYTNIATLVRIGIASERDYVTGDSLKFESVTIRHVSV